MCAVPFTELHKHDCIALMWLLFTNKLCKLVKGFYILLPYKVSCVSVFPLVVCRNVLAEVVFVVSQKWDVNIYVCVCVCVCALCKCLHTLQAKNVIALMDVMVAMDLLELLVKMVAVDCLAVLVL